MWRYRNPVEIAFGSNAFDRLPSLVAGRRYALVTYPDGAFAEAAERLLMAESGRSAFGLLRGKADADSHMPFGCRQHTGPVVA
jgi:hypothetical protein